MVSPSLAHARRAAKPCDVQSERRQSERRQSEASTSSNFGRQWVEGAERFRNRDDDLPSDFGARRTACYVTATFAVA